MSESQDLFVDHHSVGLMRPLAARVRPSSVDHVIGQRHLLGDAGPLRKAFQNNSPYSLIFWGPPGVGKTTLARLFAEHCDAEFDSLSAIHSGVKDIRSSLEQAAKRLNLQGRRTILFVDEVHRFNKSQQDAFLPGIEDGTIIFIGATTENPSFEINNALLSRLRVHVLESLSEQEIVQLLSQAIVHPDGLEDVSLTDDIMELIARHSRGDARRALNTLEISVELARLDKAEHARSKNNTYLVTTEHVEQALGNDYRLGDNQGEIFYDLISALHKSIRGSSPDAALYWLARMLCSGIDPIYIARRLVRIASEDIGNADPRALTLAMSCWDVQERLGSPEGELALAQCVSYLSAAAKSVAVYNAYKQAMAFVKKSGDLPVPLHLRNGVTELMRSEGYGSDYRYAHDYPGAFVAGEDYFPDDISDADDSQALNFYQPVDRGMEIKIGEKIDYLEQLNRNSPWKRRG